MGWLLQAQPGAPAHSPAGASAVPPTIPGFRLHFQKGPGQLLSSLPGAGRKLGFLQTGALEGWVWGSHPGTIRPGQWWARWPDQVTPPSTAMPSCPVLAVPPAFSPQVASEQGLAFEDPKLNWLYPWPLGHTRGCPTGPG